MAIAPGPCGLLWRCGLSGVASTAFQAAQGNDLLPQLNLEGEGAGSPAEDGVGAVVERVERGDNGTMLDPNEAGAEGIGRELAR